MCGTYFYVINAVLSELPHASKILLLALSVTFLFVPQISREPLNGFAPNSQGTRVWSFAGMSLNAKVKGQGHQGQKRVSALPSPPAATEWSRLLHAARYNAMSTGGLRAVHVW